MSETKTIESREYERHALESEVHIYTVLEETKVLLEKTVLKNISSGGFCFLAKRPKLYSIGQKIFLHICLPGTDKMNAGMECMARVIWIHHMQSGETEKQQAVIGVCMDGLLSFEKTVFDQAWRDNKAERRS